MRSSFAVLLTCVIANTASADDWPAWRGPRGDGVCDERNLPTTWSATQNVRWKAPLPEPCNSTPIVWGDRVFVTQGLDGGKRRAVIAFDRKDGTKLWQKELPCTVAETTHKQNPPCSASPVTDGSAVYAWFASAGVVAYDFDGKQLWHRDLGPIVSRWGNGSSPVLYKDLLIVFHGPGAPNTFLIALDKRTGKTVWKSDETALNSPIFGCWSTPILATIGGRDELILPLPGEKEKGDGYFKAYDPNTGKTLWTCKGLGTEIYAMPALNETRDLVVGICGHNGPLLGVKPGGSGEIAPLWRHTTKNPQRVGSGVFHRGRFYLADAPGFVECIDSKTGEPHWKERVDGNLWGSMLLADSKIYVSSLEGDTFVLAASDKYQLLAQNKLGEPIYAAPAVSNGDIFLRTYQNLYCISQEPKKTGKKPVGVQGPVGCGKNPKKVDRLIIDKPGVYENYLVDCNWQGGNRVKITADKVTLRNCEIMNATGNGVGVFGKDVTIENCKIHHLLNGSYKDQKDAHGITGRWTNVTIRNCEIYYVSGDAVQLDPDRKSTGKVLIEDCTFWTGPLPADAGTFKKGERPGENAIDTKTPPGGPRCEMMVRNCYFHGYNQPAQINNVAALNLKENVLVTVENCVLRDNDIAFRVRGPNKKGGAHVIIRDCAVYDSTIGVRMEDKIENLKIERLGFGAGVGKKYHKVAGSPGPGYENKGEYQAPAIEQLLKSGF